MTLRDSISYIVHQIRVRGSRIRGRALSLIRPFIISTLGFKRGTEGPVLLTNQQLAQKLKPADGAWFPFKVLAQLYSVQIANVLSLGS